MTKKLLGIFVLGLLISLAVPSANAQDMSRISIFAGYNWSTNSIDNSICDGEFCGTTGLSGYTLSGVYNLNNHFGLEANFDGHNGSPVVGSCTSADEDCYEDNNTVTTTLRQDLYTYTFGPKFTTGVGPFSLFAHVLVGGEHAHEGVTDEGCYTEIEGVGAGDPCYRIDSGQVKGNGFALKTGGGLDWIHGHFGIRIVEVDYVHISGTVSDQEDGYSDVYKYHVSANNVEVQTGVTFNFGGMK